MWNNAMTTVVYGTIKLQIYSLPIKEIAQHITPTVKPLWYFYTFFCTEILNLISYNAQNLKYKY